MVMLEICNTEALVVSSGCIKNTYPCWLPAMTVLFCGPNVPLPHTSSSDHDTVVELHNTPVGG
jgi:hypothetical protein